MRWFAVIVVGVLCASVPVVHIVWHGLLDNEEPVLVTRSQEPAQAATVDNVMSGEWMTLKERELQEVSPVVWSLRGHWNELRYRLGVPHSDRVWFGRDDWLFVMPSVRPDLRGFERAKDKRLAAFVKIRDAIRAAGAELIVTVVPDKARVYKDFAFEDGVMPKRTADNYATIMAELESLGIAHVDLATPMAAARAAITSTETTEQLYYARDTHWQPAGALVAGTAIGAAVEIQFGSRLSPRQQLRLTGPNRSRTVGDLTMMLGMLAHVRPDPILERRDVSMSLLTDELSEVRDYYGANLVTKTGTKGLFGEAPDAEVYLAGTSFSKANGMVAVTMGLGRPVHLITNSGATGLGPIRNALKLLRSGKKPKLVIWEIVERGLFDAAWQDPKL